MGAEIFFLTENAEMLDDKQLIYILVKVVCLHLIYNLSIWQSYAIVVIFFWFLLFTSY